jgi:hypothetical protein
MRCRRTTSSKLSRRIYRCGRHPHSGPDSPLPLNHRQDRHPDGAADAPHRRVRMIRRRAADACLKSKIGCHTFRATGITAYLEAGGTLENARAMAAHGSPRTAKLYDRNDRTADVITLDEVERIVI